MPHASKQQPVAYSLYKTNLFILLSMRSLVCMRWLGFALLLPNTSWAHGSFDSSPVFDGMVHGLTSPLAYALLLALAILSEHLDEQLHYQMVGAASLAAATTGLALAWSGMSLHPNWSDAIAASGAAALGLLAVVGVICKVRVLLVFALIAGVLAVISCQLDSFGIWQTFGLTLGILMITALSFAAFRAVQDFPNLQAVMPLAKRIAGAWISCMSLLILALAVVMLARPSNL